MKDIINFIDQTKHETSNRNCFYADIDEGISICTAEY